MRDVMENTLKRDFESMYISTNNFDCIPEEEEDISILFRKNLHLDDGRRLRSLRLPVRALPYILSMGQAPKGKRDHIRWMNDNHVGNPETTGNNMEEMMQHLHLQVNWRSNFQELAKDHALQNAFLEAKDIGEVFREISERLKTDTISSVFADVEAEYMFSRMDRRARVLLSKSLLSFRPFLEATEHATLHFIKWQEAPSDLEVMPALCKMLVSPLETTESALSVKCLRIPLVNSSFHRLMVHALCQFYGLQSKTEQTEGRSSKAIVILQPHTEKLERENLATISLCRFLLETRFPNHENNQQDSMELVTRTSDCSDGYCVMDFPET